MPTAQKSPHPTDRHVGSRVRLRRMILKMSQEKLSGALRISFQQVQKYEKGNNRISASRLRDIAQILQVPLSFFFEGGPNSRGNKFGAVIPAHVSGFLSSREGLRLAMAFVTIKNPKLRQSIVDLIEKLQTSAPKD